MQDRLQSLRATTGFDYLRLILAIVVVTVHSFCASYGGYWESMHIWLGPIGGPLRSVLCMFFALSGFLVAGSIFRAGSISGFVALRLMRIMPALAVEVLVTGILLGAWLSFLPPAQYYHTTMFWRYFLNLIWDIQYHLPGVFPNQPYGSTVNVSLWTLPSDRNCYFILILLMVMGIVKRRVAMLYIALYCSIVYFLQYEDHMDHRLVETGAVDSDALLTCFIWGVVFYLYAEKIRLNAWLAALAMGIGWTLLYTKHMAYFAAPLITYATIFLGMCNPRKLPLFFTGDYSYGLYLYSFPVQQALIQLLPHWRVWWANLFLALPIAGFIAFLSWHGIEKHALSYKRNVVGKDSAIARAEQMVTDTFKRSALAIYHKATRSS